MCCGSAIMFWAYRAGGGRGATVSDDARGWLAGHLLGADSAVGVPRRVAPVDGRRDGHLAANTADLRRSAALLCRRHRPDRLWRKVNTSYDDERRRRDSSWRRSAT